VTSDDIGTPLETAGLASQGDTIDSTLTDPLIGTTLAGHLEILSCVGWGGMSVVYKAKDLLLYRTVAVKVLRSHSAVVPKSIKRFRYEAIAASKLDHPNIIRVYEFNIPDQGAPYLVMDYLEGSSLAQFIAKNGAIELRRAISIMTKVCEGLEHAHKAGVIHRDLKPGNIMLVKDQDGQQSVKIVDFGIAKMLHNEDEDSPSLTKTGDLVGSPLYMSPEQCQGEPVDKRSDVYALGCVMYEMLTGKPPFKGSTMLETVQMQTSAIPKPVRERFPGIKNADKIDTILLKAMAKQPAQRYQSAHDFKAAIQELNAGSGASLLARIKLQLELARNKSIAQKKEKVATYSLILTMVASVAITICIFISNQSLHHQSTELTPTAQSPPVVQSPAPNLTAENPELAWTNADLAAQEAVNAGDYKSAQREYEKSKELARNIGTEYQLSTLEGLSDLNDLTGHDRKAFEKDIDRLATLSMNTQNTQRLINALKTADAQKDRDSMTALIDQSVRLSNRINQSGRFSESQKLLKSALDAGQHYLNPNDLTIANCLSSLGDTWHITDIEAEREYRQKAYAIAKKHPRDDLFERCAYLLGRSYAENEQPKLAEPYLKEALKASITLNGASSKQSAQSCYQLAQCYLLTKTQALSNATEYEALSMLQSLKQGARDAESDYQLAQVESGLKHKGDALRDASRSLGAYENGPAKNYPMIAECCHLLASNYPKTSPQRLALRNRRTAILNRMNQLTPLYDAEIHRSQADSYLENGDYGKAKTALQPSIDLVDGWPKGKPVPRQLAKSLLMMARVYTGLGDQTEAEKYCLQYKSLATASNGAKSYPVAIADAQLALIYADGNQREKAIAQINHYLQFCKTYQPTPDQLDLFNKDKVDLSRLLADLQKGPLPNNGKNRP
jgi:serine/threonine protein kinase